MVYHVTFEDMCIHGLDCGTPSHDLGYFRFFTLVPRRFGGSALIPETIDEDSLASWVGESWPDYGALRA